MTTIQIHTKIKRKNEILFTTIATEISFIKFKFRTIKFRVSTRLKFYFRIRSHAIKFKFRTPTRLSVHTVRSVNIRSVSVRPVSIRPVSIKFASIRPVSIRSVSIRFRTSEMTSRTIQFRFCIEINFYAIALKDHIVLRTIVIRIFTIEFGLS